MTTRSTKHNIIILNDHAGAPDTGGRGHHYELGKFLSEHGHRVSVIASSYIVSKREYCKPESISVTWFNESFSFIGLRTKPVYRDILGRFMNYYDYMRKASRLDDFGYIPDVIIASSVHPLAWVAGHRLSMRYDARSIVEVRDLWPLSMYEDFGGLKRALVFKCFEALERKYYSLADAIVTTAPFAYEYMEEKFNINRNKICHIPHGIDINEFDKNAQLSEEILDPELRTVLNSNFCVTYTGALSKSEGLDTFVEAAKYLRDIADIKLVIVGGGNEANNLAKVIEAEGLENAVMIPAQPRHSMPLTLKKSKILFCGLMERRVFRYGISKNEFYDYMAAQKPIVFASSVRDSLIDKAQAGITIKPGDPRLLVSTIKHIYDNIDTIGKEYGENGRTYVERNHSIEKIAGQFLKVIESCQFYDL
jgi:glycosyltransferase involved in cell wall biosynthesis